ncbi:molecular chaperone DnaJ [Fischerella thermalis CCMEE 5198]|jgi:curved DNA-binding protein CbpA|uniref:J domain-containing protein n=1 Tax=Fischerella thermalis TaxID=372787 RepID=UPI000C80F6B6|nr:tetratricopeptide repeat protein [Fischerella thermalis]PMB07235.1 molecular chaperone DnaJ [Fischerella thermalis CCMEE 5196]PMB18206.1 molecular chaperone DnaJ [Fischerella thermalis CCMEE 5198]
MFFKIDRGLFKYDFIDYHAILGVPINISIQDIRKRYLKIARRLHPDSCALSGEVEKELASDLLSKLVNPAYEKLSQEKNYTEYILVLSQMGKRLVQESASVELTSDVAKQLVSIPNLEQAYKMAIAKIAETQYNYLQQSIEVIAQISELNLVYLMRSAGKAVSTPPPPPKPTLNSTTPQPNTATAPPPPPAAAKEDSAAEHYLRRAQTLIDKNQFAQAKVELQDALKLEPKNSRCHSLIALVYMKQNQLKMAKIHFDNALKLDPNDQLALTWKPKIEKALGLGPTSSQVTSPPKTATKQPDKSGGGGLFGGLFGGKKK